MKSIPTDDCHTHDDHAPCMCDDCWGGKKACVLCGQPTTGSIGAAGLRWTIVCQSCKDEEDESLRVTMGIHKPRVD